MHFLYIILILERDLINFSCSKIFVFIFFSQDIFNNSFGDYNNQLIATMGKSTEITDMVLQQQPENEFCNLTDTLTNNLNSINNNKINNGSHDDADEQEVNMEQADDDFMAIDHHQNQELQQQIAQQVPDIENDDNNNRDNANNFGPETDVDAILEDEEFHNFVNVASGGGGEKELTQMEFKETADVIDHAQQQVEMHYHQENPSNAMFGTLENKIFGEMFPDMKGSNPFEMAHELMDNFVANVDMPLDNKIIEEQIDEMQQHQHELQQQFEFGANDFIEKAENVEREIDFAMHETAASAVGFMEELISSANNEEVAIHQEEQPQHEQQPQSSESFHFNVVHMSKKVTVMNCTFGPASMSRDLI